MGIVSWILIGIVAGVVASVISGHTDGTGYLFNIVVGTLGALAGGFAANLVTQNPVFGVSWQSAFVGLMGALVFLAVGNAVQRR
jgi:uncharacterized membrane protein YeaQ/YmgE (transglycosylase-associated protein family)